MDIYNGLILNTIYVRYGCRRLIAAKGKLEHRGGLQNVPHHQDSNLQHQHLRLAIQSIFTITPHWLIVAPECIAYTTIFVGLRQNFQVLPP